MRRAWFLHRRITVAFSITAFLLSIALALPFGWILHATVLNEIEALTREEVEEVRAYFSGQIPTHEEFHHIVEEMRDQHEENPLAWRIRSTDGTPWGDFGQVALLERLPARWPASFVVEAPDASTRVAVAPLDNGMEAGVVIDFSQQVRGFSHFILAALGFTLVATVGSTFAGRLLALRVSGLLTRVAECARTEADPSSWLPPGEAPQEIQAVVSGLQDTLRRIHDEGEKARLLTSGMAHELRSPLQNMMGETQVTLLREREASEYRRVLESQLEELGELSRVVDNLVTLSSVEEARRRKSVELFDLAAEANLRLSREHELARRRGVELRVETVGPLDIEGDRESLLLALRNVVTNAIEWSPPGGVVEVCMRAQPGGFEITVDDSGPGVPAAEREAIFRPFHQGPAAKGRRVGFGLGLALTHSAVKAQGGTITVGDSPRGGARFQIALPLMNAEGESTEA